MTTDVGQSVDDVELFLQDHLGEGVGGGIKTQLLLTDTRLSLDRRIDENILIPTRTSLNSLYSSSGMIFSTEYRARTRSEPGSMPFRGTWELRGNHSSIICPFWRRFNWQRMNTDKAEDRREVRQEKPSLLENGKTPTYRCHFLCSFSFCCSG